MEVKVKSDLQKTYNEYYRNKEKTWRKLGAEGKYDNIKTLVQDLPLNKVIEVGAGDGSILELLEKDNFASQLYALEISESGLEVIKEKTLPHLIEALKFDG